MTKLRIDLKNGFLEVEGEETFVKEIYGDYKDVFDHLIARQAEGNRVPSLEAPVEPVNEKPSEEKKIKKSSATKHSSSKETHKILGDVNFNVSEKPSLKDFVAAKKPSESGGELMTVLVYYLQKTLELKNLTADHVYTAYKEVGVKVPTALNQGLKTVKIRKGWLETADMNDIHTTIKGDNLVEHELPRSMATEPS